jgi:DNA invertase Pin-like site-specific DNA recombinase
MASGKFIAYYRVSTGKQSASGLGLDAQKSAVADYLNGGNWELVSEFTEVETGTRKGNGRPMLSKALEACKIHCATLVIAKLDRLYRNVAAQSALMESGVDFIAVDNPTASKFTLHILAAVAEHEAGMISKRTREALAARKAKGLPMGSQCWNSTSGMLSKENQEVGRSIASKVIKDKADNRARLLLGKIEEIKQETGSATFHQIAMELNKRNIPTVGKGKAWAYASVRNLLSRV